jgi:hypothetical protein
MGARYIDMLSTNVGGNEPNSPQEPGAGGSSSGVSVSKQKIEFFQASDLQTLRTGGKSSNKIVDVIVFAGGRTLSYDEKGRPLPFKKLPFPQEG